MVLAPRWGSCEERVPGRHLFLAAAHVHTTNRCDFSDRLLRISQFEHSQIVEGDREPLFCARADEGTTGAWVQTQVYQGPGLFYSTPPA